MPELTLIPRGEFERVLRADLYTNRGFRPFFESGAMDLASVDVIWNGFHQAKKIADLAETFEVNCNVLREHPWERQ